MPPEVTSVLTIAPDVHLANYSPWRSILLSIVIHFFAIISRLQLFNATRASPARLFLPGPLMAGLIGFAKRALDL